MIRRRILLILAVAFCPAVFTYGETSAFDNSEIKYATVCANTERLAQIGAELRSVFAADFRQSGVYRKLAWNSGKLKRQSARLNRIAHRKSECRWEKQIRHLDEIVCTLEERIAEAHHRFANRIDPPCNASPLIVDQLIVEARELVLGLMVATGIEEVVIEQQPAVQQPLREFETAPNYNPGPPTVLPEFPAPTLQAPSIPEPPLSAPLELPLDSPLQLPSDTTPSLNPPAFEIPAPEGATIVPDVTPRSVLDTPLPIETLDQAAFFQGLEKANLNGPALTGPPPNPIVPAASYDEAKILKKLNSK